MFNALLEKLISDKSYKYFEDLKKAEPACFVSS